MARCTPGTCGRRDWVSPTKLTPTAGRCFAPAMADSSRACSPESWSRFTLARRRSTTVAFRPLPAITRALPATSIPRNLQFDPATRAPRTDEYSIGVDRAVGRRLTRVDRVRPQGWRRLHRVDGCRRPVCRGTPEAGRRQQRAGVLARYGRHSCGRPPLSIDQSRRLLDDLQRTGDGGREAAVQGWQVFGSYTWSKAYGLLALQRHDGGGRADRARSRRRSPRPSAAIPTISPTRAAGCRTIARTCASDGQRRRAANGVRARRQPATLQRQAVGRGRTNRAAAGPSAAYPARAARLSPAVVTNAARPAPVEAIPLGGHGRIDLLLDVLNVLNDTAEESLATETQMTETQFSATFGQPVSFVDPRRAMIGVRLNLGQWTSPSSIPTATAVPIAQPAPHSPAGSHFQERRDRAYEKTERTPAEDVSGPQSGDAAGGPARSIGLALGPLTASSSSTGVRTHAGEP